MAIDLRTRIHGRIPGDPYGTYQWTEADTKELYEHLKSVSYSTQGKLSKDPIARDFIRVGSQQLGRRNTIAEQLTAYAQEQFKQGTAEAVKIGINAEDFRVPTEAIFDFGSGSSSNKGKQAEQAWQLISSQQQALSRIQSATQQYQQTGQLKIPTRQELYKEQFGFIPTAEQLQGQRAGKAAAYLSGQPTSKVAALPTGDIRKDGYNPSFVTGEQTLEQATQTQAGSPAQKPLSPLATSIKQQLDAGVNVGGQPFTTSQRQSLEKQYQQASGQAYVSGTAPIPATSAQGTIPVDTKGVVGAIVGTQGQSSINALIDKALTSGGTKYLQKQPWWNSQPDTVRQAAYAQLQKVTGSAQEMAKYVLSKGLTDLQQYDWWKNSPFKQEAWKLIQQQQGLVGAGAVSPLDEKESIDAEANKIMQEELAQIQKETNKVDLSASEGLIEQLQQSLEERKQEPVPSLQKTFEDQRAQLGVGKIEDALAQIDADIAALDADFTSTLPEEEARRVSVRGIRRRQSEIELQYNRQRRDLIAERSSLAGELSQKYGVINSIVNLAGQDIDNAQQKYDKEFNQAISMINLVKGVEEDAKADEERRIDNARANVQIMTNLLKEGNIEYDQLDAGTLADIRKMELQAGLPNGFVSFVHEQVPEPVTSFLPQFEDSSGNRILPVVTKGANGEFSVTNITLGKTGTVGQGVTGAGSSSIPVDVSAAIGAGSLPKVGTKTSNALGSGIITGYGSKLWKPGLDYVVDGGMGANVVAPAAGEVIQVDTGHVKGETGSFGNRVKIKLASGEQVWLSHLQSTAVKKGDFVQAGQTIGGQGNTGSVYGKTGIHVDITMTKKSGGYYTAEEVQRFLSGVGSVQDSGTVAGAEGVISKAEFKQLAEQSAQLSLSPVTLDNLYNEYVQAAQGQVSQSTTVPETEEDTGEFRY